MSVGPSPLEDARTGKKKTALYDCLKQLLAKVSRPKEKQRESLFQALFFSKLHGCLLAPPSGLRLPLRFPIGENDSGWLLHFARASLKRAEGRRRRRRRCVVAIEGRGEESQSDCLRRREVKIFWSCDRSAEREGRGRKEEVAERFHTSIIREKHHPTPACLLIL